MDIALKWLTLLHNPEDIVEIRSIDPKPVISGYFKADSAAIAKEIARFPNRTFYQTLQMVQPACYMGQQTSTYMFFRFFRLLFAHKNASLLMA